MRPMAGTSRNSSGSAAEGQRPAKEHPDGEPQLAADQRGDVDLAEAGLGVDLGWPTEVSTRCGSLPCGGS